MKQFINVFVLILGLSGSLALHIVMSPEEAEKIMKREDEFSKGLAGFVDQKMRPTKDSKETTIDKIKRLLSDKLGSLNKRKKDNKDQISVEIKKSAPPALPLDLKKDTMAGLEQMVDKLVKEVDEKQKRSCTSYKCMVNYGREAEHAKEADHANEIDNSNEAKRKSEDSIERVYQSVKRLLKSQKEASNSKKSVADSQSSENVISDAGDRMLEKVRNLIKKKSQGNKAKIYEDSNPKSDTEKRSDIEEKVEKLLHKVSQITKKETAKDAGELALNAVKEIIAKREHAARSKATEVKDQSKDSLDEVKKELSTLLNKLSSRKDEKDVTADDVALENQAKRAAVSKRGDKGRQMIMDLLKTYDELTRRKDGKKSDVYASELENASRTLKRSNNAHAKLMKGFDQSDAEENAHQPHPK